MYKHRPWLEEELQQRTEDRQTASLVGIVIILLILVSGLFLVHQLGHTAAIQDCLLAGYRNCDAMVGSN